VIVLPAGFRLSIVIPAFNEVRTIDAVIAQVRATQLPCEIIVVDDGSHDGTREKLEQYAHAPDIVALFHDRNRGKGAALKTGFLRATGNVVLVQDADLEYNPLDYSRLIEPILENRADVVFGSRFPASNDVKQSSRMHRCANRLVTMVSNGFTGLRLTDMETCYKVFRREVIAQIAPALQETGFGIEPELTARVARLPNVRILEVPIHYSARSYAEGKKIGWRDGLWAIWCAMRY
jgi:glycosyltransferase involved in cell wall biosynthesis